MTETQPAPFNERLLLLTLAAIQFTHIVDFMIMMPLGPQLMRLFGISPQQFSGLVSAYTFSAGAVGFLAASFIDRFDRKTMLLISYLGFVLGTFSCALSPNYHFLLISRIVTGAFGGVQGSLVMAIIGDVIPYERRATAMGQVMAAFSAAAVFGVPMGLYIATLWSWHAPFFALAVSGLFVIGLIGYFVPKLRDHIHATRPPVSELFTNVAANPNQLRGLTLTVMLMLGQFTVIPFLSPSMVANVGFTERQLTWIYFIGGAVTIFSSQGVGRLADRFTNVRVFSWSALLAIIPIFLITHLGPTPIPFVLLITTAFFVISGGRMIPAMTLITSTVRPQQRGGFMSLNSAVQQLAAGAASMIAGMIVIKNETGQLLHYERVGYLAIAASFMCVLLARGIRPLDVAKAHV